MMTGFIGWDSSYNANAPVERFLNRSRRNNADRGAGPMNAAQTFAALTRQQWANYLSQTVPFENRLIDYSNDPRVVTDAMSEASADAQQAFRNRAAVQQRGLRSLGVTLDADEQRAAARSTNLAGSLADVNAQNMTRDATVARQRSVLGSPVPTLPRMD